MQTKTVTCPACGDTFQAEFTDEYGEPDDEYPCSPECNLREARE